MVSDERFLQMLRMTKSKVNVGVRETTQETPKGMAQSRTHVVSERIGECKE
jgi:hypothetical protein